jgi:hypothetical protein
MVSLATYTNAAEANHLTDPEDSRSAVFNECVGLYAAKHNITETEPADALRDWRVKTSALKNRPWHWKRFPKSSYIRTYIPQPIKNPTTKLIAGFVLPVVAYLVAWGGIEPPTQGSFFGRRQQSARRNSRRISDKRTLPTSKTRSTLLDTERGRTSCGRNAQRQTPQRKKAHRNGRA